jgi:chorismate mutase-like protein
MTHDEALRILEEYRDQIDDVDRRILALLNERTLVVEQIGRVKQEMSMPVYEPKREDEVFQNIATHNPGPLPGDAAKRVFERIIDEMRTVQRLKMLRRQAAESEAEENQE